MDIEVNLTALYFLNHSQSQLPFRSSLEPSPVLSLDNSADIPLCTTCHILSLKIESNMD
jgi:hypothetical protein